MRASKSRARRAIVSAWRPSGSAERSTADAAAGQDGRRLVRTRARCGERSPSEPRPAPHAWPRLRGGAPRAAGSRPVGVTAAPSRGHGRRPLRASARPRWVLCNLLLVFGLRLRLLRLGRALLSLVLRLKRRCGALLRIFLQPRSPLPRSAGLRLRGVRLGRARHRLRPRCVRRGCQRDRALPRLNCLALPCLGSEPRRDCDGLPSLGNVMQRDCPSSLLAGLRPLRQRVRGHSCHRRQQDRADRDDARAAADGGGRRLRVSRSSSRSAS